MLTAEVASQIWRYDPQTGFFFWLISPRYDVLVGDRAGNFDGKYWRLRYKHKNYKASRVAWLMVYGEWPTLQVDHINGIKTDDRITNLRQASNSENLRNRPATKKNKLGVKGVSRTRYSYVAQISVNGENKRLGSFKTVEAAKQAYNKAAIVLHGEYANTGER